MECSIDALFSYLCICYTNFIILVFIFFARDITRSSIFFWMSKEIRNHYLIRACNYIGEVKHTKKILYDTLDLKIVCKNRTLDILIRELCTTHSIILFAAEALYISWSWYDLDLIVRRGAMHLVRTGRPFNHLGHPSASSALHLMLVGVLEAIFFEFWLAVHRKRKKKSCCNE